MIAHVKVKICGITNWEDAQAAAEAGADYLGFIFYPPSKRTTNPAAAGEIVRRLRERPRCPTLVGVFVNETAEQMAAVLADCGLDLAQLSGEETPSLVNDPKSAVFGRAYKALKPQSVGEAEAEAEWFVAVGVRPTLLLDAYHPKMKGGTGDLSDWEIGRHMVRLTDGLMLAGGLTPQNVAQAVREVCPFAVDVASGVEASPGKKDHTAVRAFIANAKGAGHVG